MLLYQEVVPKIENTRGKKWRKKQQRCIYSHKYPETKSLHYIFKTMRNCVSISRGKVWRTWCKNTPPSICSMCMRAIEWCVIYEEQQKREEQNFNNNNDRINKYEKDEHRIIRKMELTSFQAQTNCFIILTNEYVFQVQKTNNTTHTRYICQERSEEDEGDEEEEEKSTVRFKLFSFASLRKYERSEC